MKHYFNPMSRAVTSDWMLKELDAEHERIVIDIQAGEQNSSEYRAINPMGKVPTLVDGDTVITEAAAICAYLADKFAEKGVRTISRLTRARQVLSVSLLPGYHP